MTARLPALDLNDALTTAGALCHYIASDPTRAEEFARYIEHCPGDLTVASVTAYLAAVHDLLVPGCPVPATISEIRGQT
jgi:hypothetical protein